MGGENFAKAVRSHPDWDDAPDTVRVDGVHFLRQLDRVAGSPTPLPIRERPDDAPVLRAADFSRIRNADLGRFTVDRLMAIINRLGSRVEVKIRVRPVERVERPATA